MKNRKPRKDQLNHTLTLWNYTHTDPSGHKQYQKTILRACALTFAREQNAGLASDALRDCLYCQIYPGVTSAVSPAQAARAYLPPDEFLDAQDKTPYWTLNAGCDYIAMGANNTDLGSLLNRPTVRLNDRAFALQQVLYRYGAGFSVHHYELYAR